MTDTLKYAWSYSSLDLYKLCPHRYMREKVVKDIPREPDTAAIIYGKEFHKAAEEYIRDGVAIPDKFKFVQGTLDTLNNLAGTKLCEYEMGLTKGLEPCSFSDKENVWWRGVADLIIVNGDSARVVDYKTGKSARYADTKQLEILSLAVFKHFPEVKHIKAALLFVVANDVVKAKYSSDDAHTHWVKWLETTYRLENAYKTGVWNPKPNFTCSKFCPVKDCTHHGRGGYR